MQPVTDFHHSTAPEPHRVRTKMILKEHPEVRKLIGKNPYTIWAIVGRVAL
ncbi:MAG TPA: fatty acid desaturase, partial [Chitinophagaceae bacterium]|nr:fatty acid desaturase [Chitinophagaceae bacterium]